jgi:hypothetical protein
MKASVRQKEMKLIINWFYYKKVVFYFAFIVFYSMIFCFTPSVQAQDWYIRAVIGYESSQSADFSDDDCGSSSPPALFCC